MGSDTGIDLVALKHDGDYWAIQCKCYSEDAVIDKKSVDSFCQHQVEHLEMTNLKQLDSHTDCGFQLQISEEEMLKNRYEIKIFLFQD